MVLSSILSLALIWTSGNVAQAVAITPAVFPAASNLPQIRLVPPQKLGRIVDYFNASPVSSSQLAVSRNESNRQSQTTKRQPLVVLIQDLHAHYGVQKNISGILEFLSSKLVNSPTLRSSTPPTLPFALAVEGASGPIDSSVMALFPDEKMKLTASDFLMKEGEITGAEYFAIKRGIPSLLVGVENEQYYTVHRDLFRKTFGEREHLVKALSAIQADIAALPRLIYKGELKAFQRKVDAFDKGEIGTEEFVSFLWQQQIQRHAPPSPTSSRIRPAGLARYEELPKRMSPLGRGISNKHSSPKGRGGPEGGEGSAIDVKSQFPALSSFISNGPLGPRTPPDSGRGLAGSPAGSALGPDSLRASTAAFFQTAQSYLSGEEKKNLTVLAKQTDSQAYFLYVRELIYQHQLFLATPPELAKYLEYLHTSQTMGMDRIQHEAKEFAFALEKEIAQTQQQKDLVQVQHDLDLLKRLSDLQATEYEVRAFAPRLNQFVALCKTLLGSEGGRNGGPEYSLNTAVTPTRPPSDPPTRPLDDLTIRRLISSSIDYYVMAMLRNEPMVENTLALIGERPEETRVRAESKKTPTKKHRTRNTPSPIISSLPLGPRHTAGEASPDVWRARPSGLSTAVLVAGGFHTAPITEILRAKNISYIVISPTVETITDHDHELYISRLNGLDVTVDEIRQAAQEAKTPRLTKSHWVKFWHHQEDKGLAAGTRPLRFVYGYAFIALLAGQGLLSSETVKDRARNQTAQLAIGLLAQNTGPQTNPVTSQLAANSAESQRTQSNRELWLEKIYRDGVLPAGHAYDPKTDAYVFDPYLAAEKALAELLGNGAAQLVFLPKDARSTVATYDSAEPTETHDLSSDYIFIFRNPHNRTEYWIKASATNSDLDDWSTEVKVVKAPEASPSTAGSPRLSVGTIPQAPTPVSEAIRKQQRLHDIYARIGELILNAGSLLGGKGPVSKENEVAFQALQALQVDFRTLSSYLDNPAAEALNTLLPSIEEHRGNLLARINFREVAKNNDPAQVAHAKETSAKTPHPIGYGQGVRHVLNEAGDQALRKNAAKLIEVERQRGPLTLESSPKATDPPSKIAAPPTETEPPPADISEFPVSKGNDRSFAFWRTIALAAFVIAVANLPFLSGPPLHARALHDLQIASVWPLLPFLVTKMRMPQLISVYGILASLKTAYLKIPLPYRLAAFGFWTAAFFANLVLPELGHSQLELSFAAITGLAAFFFLGKRVGTHWIVGTSAVTKTGALILFWSKMHPQWGWYPVDVVLETVFLSTLLNLGSASNWTNRIYPGLRVTTFAVGAILSILSYYGIGSATNRASKNISTPPAPTPSISQHLPQVKVSQPTTPIPQRAPLRAPRTKQATSGLVHPRASETEINPLLLKRALVYLRRELGHPIKSARLVRQVQTGAALRLFFDVPSVGQFTFQVLPDGTFSALELDGVHTDSSGQLKERPTLPEPSQVSALPASVYSGDMGEGLSSEEKADILNRSTELEKTRKNRIKVETRYELARRSDLTSADEINFGSASNNQVGYSTLDHLQFHEEADFDRIIRAIGREINAPLRIGGWKGATTSRLSQPKHWYDLRRAVEAAGGQITLKNGGSLRLDRQTGILVIISPDFKVGHAGRNQFAVYARDEAEAAHEIHELSSWATFAVTNKIATKKDISDGLLGNKFLDYLNNRQRKGEFRKTLIAKIKRRNLGYHRQAVKIESQFRKKEGLRELPPFYPLHARISIGTSEKQTAEEEFNWMIRDNGDPSISNDLLPIGIQGSGQDKDDQKGPLLARTPEDAAAAIVETTNYVAAHLERSPSAPVSDDRSDLAQQHVKESLGVSAMEFPTEQTQPESRLYENMAKLRDLLRLELEKTESKLAKDVLDAFVEHYSGILRAHQARLAQQLFPPLVPPKSDGENQLVHPDTYEAGVVYYRAPRFFRVWHLTQTFGQLTAWDRLRRWIVRRAGFDPSQSIKEQLFADPLQKDLLEDIQLKFGPSYEQHHFRNRSSARAFAESHPVTDADIQRYRATQPEAAEFSDEEIRDIIRASRVEGAIDIAEITAIAANRVALMTLLFVFVLFSVGAAVLLTTAQSDFHAEDPTNLVGFFASFVLTAILLPFGVGRLRADKVGSRAHSGLNRYHISRNSGAELTSEKREPENQDLLRPAPTQWPVRETPFIDLNEVQNYTLWVGQVPVRFGEFKNSALTLLVGEETVRLLARDETVYPVYRDPDTGLLAIDILEKDNRRLFFKSKILAPSVWPIHAELQFDPGANVLWIRHSGSKGRTCLSFTPADSGSGLLKAFSIQGASPSEKEVFVLLRKPEYSDRALETGSAFMAYAPLENLVDFKEAVVTFRENTSDLRSARVADQLLKEADIRIGLILKTQASDRGTSDPDYLSGKASPQNVKAPAGIPLQNHVFRILIVSENRTQSAAVERDLRVALLNAEVRHQFEIASSWEDSVRPLTLTTDRKPFDLVISALDQDRMSPQERELKIQQLFPASRLLLLTERERPRVGVGEAVKAQVIDMAKVFELMQELAAPGSALDKAVETAKTISADSNKDAQLAAIAPLEQFIEKMRKLSRNTRSDEERLWADSLSDYLANLVEPLHQIADSVVNPELASKIISGRRESLSRLLNDLRSGARFPISKDTQLFDFKPQQGSNIKGGDSPALAPYHTLRWLGYSAEEAAHLGQRGLLFEMMIPLALTFVFHMPFGALGFVAASGAYHLMILLLRRLRSPPQTLLGPEDAGGPSLTQIAAILTVVSLYAVPSLLSLWSIPLSAVAAASVVTIHFVYDMTQLAPYLNATPALSDYDPQGFAHFALRGLRKVFRSLPDPEGDLDSQYAAEQWTNAIFGDWFEPVGQVMAGVSREIEAFREFLERRNVHLKPRLWEIADRWVPPLAPLGLVAGLAFTLFLMSHPVPHPHKKHLVAGMPQKNMLFVSKPAAKATSRVGAAEKKAIAVATRFVFQIGAGPIVFTRTNREPNHIRLVELHSKSGKTYLVAVTENYHVIPDYAPSKKTRPLRLPGWRIASDSQTKLAPATIPTEDPHTKTDAVQRPPLILERAASVDLRPSEKGTSTTSEIGSLFNRVAKSILSQNEYEFYTTYLASGWETVLVRSLANHFGLGWATLVFATSHFIVDWLTRTVGRIKKVGLKDGASWSVIQADFAQEDHRDLMRLRSHVVQGFVFSLPFALSSYFGLHGHVALISAFLLSFGIHSVNNWAKLYNRLPLWLKWLEVASILDGDQYNTNEISFEDRGEIGEKYGDNGHQIDGNKSVARSLEREFIVVDWDHDKTLRDFYEKVKREAGVNGFAGNMSALGKLSVLEAVFRAVKTNVRSNEDEWKKHSRLNKPMLIGEALQYGGVCRHMGILSAAILERLIQDHYLSGQIYYVRGVGHGWAVYRTSTDSIFVFDAAQQDDLVKPQMPNGQPSLYNSGRGYLPYAEAFPDAEARKIPLHTRYGDATSPGILAKTRMEDPDDSWMRGKSEMPIALPSSPGVFSQQPDGSIRVISDGPITISLQSGPQFWIEDIESMRQTNPARSDEAIRQEKGVDFFLTDPDPLNPKGYKALRLNEPVVVGRAERHAFPKLKDSPDGLIRITRISLAEFRIDKIADGEKAKVESGRHVIRTWGAWKTELAVQRRLEIVTDKSGHHDATWLIDTEANDALANCDVQPGIRRLSWKVWRALFEKSRGMGLSRDPIEIYDPGIEISLETAEKVFQRALNPVRSFLDKGFIAKLLGGVPPAVVKSLDSAPHHLAITLPGRTNPYENHVTLDFADELTILASVNENPEGPRFRIQVSNGTAYYQAFINDEPTSNRVPLVEGQRYEVGRRKGELPVPQSEWLSRRHFTFSLTTGPGGIHRLVVDDLGSGNGTVIKFKTVLDEPLSQIHQEAAKPANLDPIPPKVRVPSSRGDRVIFENPPPVEPGRIPFRKLVIARNLPFMNNATVSPDGHTIALVRNPDYGQAVLEFYDVDSGRPIGAPILLNAAASDLRFSSDGAQLVVLVGKGFQLFDLRDPTHPMASPVSVISGESATAIAVVPARNGRRWIVVASHDNSVQLWDVTDPNKAVRRMVVGGFPSYVTSLAFSPDGSTLIAGTQDFKLYSMNFSAGILSDRVPVPSSHGALISKVALSPDGQWRASGDTNEHIDLYNTTAGKLLSLSVKDKSGRSGLIRSLAFDPTSRILAVASGKRIDRWDLSDPNAPVKLAPLQDPNFLDVAIFRPNGSLLLITELGGERLHREESKGSRVTERHSYIDRPIEVFFNDRAMFFVGSFGDILAGGKPTATKNKRFDELFLIDSRNGAVLDIAVGQSKIIGANLEDRFGYQLNMGVLQVRVTRVSDKEFEFIDLSIDNSTSVQAREEPLNASATHWASALKEALDLRLKFPEGMEQQRLTEREVREFASGHVNQFSDRGFEWLFSGSGMKSTIFMTEVLLGSAAWVLGSLRFIVTHPGPLLKTFVPLLQAVGTVAIAILILGGTYWAIHGVLPEQWKAKSLGSRLEALWRWAGNALNKLWTRVTTLPLSWLARRERRRHLLETLPAAAAAVVAGPLESPDTYIPTRYVPPVLKQPFAAAAREIWTQA